MRPFPANQLPLPAILFIVVVLCVGCGGGSVGESSTLSAEQQTANYFERIRSSPVRLRKFLYLMPKGGDIHNHLSGAVKSDSYIKWATQLHDCVNLTTLKLYKPPCDARKELLPVADAAKDPALYNAMINAFSMRGLAPGVGHSHFFDTFDKFGVVSGVKSGDMLAEVMSDWKAQNVNCMDLDNFEDRMKVVLRCGQQAADPACSAKMTVRYIYQVNRILPPVEVFAQAAFAFVLSTVEPRLVGVNLVAQEDKAIALADYTTQMSMFDFLSTAVPGVKVALHAGELTPAFVAPSNLKFHIRQAVEIGGALRIGHGVDVLWEDFWQQLMNEMANRQTLVEICLTSNLDILAISGAEHPFETYRVLGVPVTLASDDAGVFRIDLTHEYAATSYDLRYGDLKNFARNALEYDFLPGRSLWQSLEPFVVVDQCSHDQPGSSRISVACRDFLDQNKHAWQQWNLESDFASFEQTIASGLNAN